MTQKRVSNRNVVIYRGNPGEPAKVEPVDPNAGDGRGHQGAIRCPQCGSLTTIGKAGSANYDNATGYRIEPGTLVYSSHNPGGKKTHSTKSGPRITCILSRQPIPPE